MVAWPQRGKPSGTRFASQSAGQPVRPRQRDGDHGSQGNHGDDAADDIDLTDLFDLAPTQPQIPSIPRLPALNGVTPPPSMPPTPPRRAARQTPPEPPISGRKLEVAADFSDYMLARNIVRGTGHGRYLARLTADQRMRLFALAARIYLPALSLAGRVDPLDRIPPVAPPTRHKNNYN